MLTDIAGPIRYSMCGNIASGVKVECCEANFCNIQVNVGTLDSTRVTNSSNIKTIPYFSIFPNILISILILIFQ